MRYLRVVLILVAAAFVVDPPEGSGCGPFLPEAQFGYLYNPGTEFLRGELGIVRPQYFRRNLVVAYRYLSGAPLTAEEIAALSPQVAQPTQWPQGLQFGGPVSAARWLAARNAVPGVAPLKSIETDRHTFVDGYYAAYQNCLDDAFDTAAATLAKRVAQWGGKSAQVAEWVRGQDEVFANCGGGEPLPGVPQTPEQAAARQPHIPAPLPADADPLLAADRQYQIAAAAFYATRYKDAEAGFRAIAADAASPWRDSAPYLAARALIREGTVGGSRDALVSAESALRAIRDDPRQARWHGSAQGLLDFVAARLRPEDRMVELGAALSRPGLGARIVPALTDYTALWDRQNKVPAERSGIADWIASFQGGGPHPIEHWQQARSTEWLVAALVAAKPNDPAAPELIAAARKIPPGNPAYATAAYYGILLQTARQQGDARQWADEALAAKPPRAARNSFLAERMSLARDWTEFLRYAPRLPVAATVAVADEPLADYRGEAPPDVTFDHDAATVLNRRVPLDLWVDAAGNALLPERLRAAVAQAGWVRAVLLDRTAEARALALRAAGLHPELAAPLREYAAENARDARRFAAVFLMLRTPGLAPVVREGFGRYTAKVGAIDSFRDNWWRLGTPAPAAAPPPADFLPPDARARADKEWEMLAAAPAAPNYLCAQTLAWARAHPHDPRVPEALHLAVRATRYGPGDPSTRAWSRQAFQLLHARYPRSEWVQKTKYWY